MEIIIIRHAQSEYNAKKTDDLNSNLTSFGQLQALETAKWLSSNFDFKNYICYTSPYLRCMQTSRVISEECKVNFKLNKDIREFYDIPNEFNKTVKVDFIKEFKDFYDVNFSYVFNIESVSNFIERINKFVESLDKSKNYLLVSHGSPCRAMYSIASNKGTKDLYERYGKSNEKKDSIDNCGITYIKNNDCIYFSKVVYQKHD